MVCVAGKEDGCLVERARDEVGETGVGVIFVTMLAAEVELPLTVVELRSVK